MAPASERKRIVGTRMRSRSAARSAPAGVPVSSGYIHCVSGPAASARITTAAPDDHHDQAEQVGGEPVGALPLALGEQRREHGHERGADRRVGEQLLHELRDHRDRDEGVVGGVDAVDGGGDDLAAEPGEARDGGGGGDDDGREGELALVIAHESSDSTAGGELLPGEPAEPRRARPAGGAAPGRAARPAPSLAEGGPASRPGRPYRRTAGRDVRAQAARRARPSPTRHPRGVRGRRQPCAAEHCAGVVVVTRVSSKTAACLGRVQESPRQGASAARWHAARRDRRLDGGHCESSGRMGAARRRSPAVRLCTERGRGSGSGTSVVVTTTVTATVSSAAISGEQSCGDESRTLTRASGWPSPPPPTTPWR